MIDEDPLASLKRIANMPIHGIVLEGPDPGPHAQLSLVTQVARDTIAAIEKDRKQIADLEAQVETLKNDIKDMKKSLAL
ncbi:MAG: hypothetical protein JWL77_3922 [Chthonomonadaceae bacterium]|nr:hypothetical protein [Chthonomonadaceae bacterium]